MIIVIGRAEVDPDKIDDLQGALDAMMRATWEESGCLSYSMAVESKSDGVVSIVERWTDEASLRAHFGQPHMAAFNAAIKGAVRSIDVMLYDVVNERPLLAG